MSAMPRVCPSCGEENPERARFCLACASPLEAETDRSRERRKTVTVVFSDLAGSTSLGERLDAESLRKIMLRYYAAMRAALEAHGGKVEKFIGDAVMAVFGVPALHEDDALRAVRAAWAMGDALKELNSELESRWGERLSTRTGVNTGEVVVGEATHGDSLAVVGDAINVAARLEQAAGSGEILLGETTYRLVSEAVEAEAVEPLTLKGKSKPVPAFRLLSLLGEEPAQRRRFDSPLIGRERELKELTDAFERVVEERSCRQAILLGEAGVGKSRLCREFLEVVGERAAVLSGRCLPYGQGITYWPVAEVVKSAASITEDDSAAQAEVKIAWLLPAEDGPIVARRIAAALGIADEVAEREDAFWALRRFFEALGAQRPLVVVFDDIQWGEATFLDLLEYLAQIGGGAPVLLLCLARPELRDARPEFASGVSQAPIELTLGPLDQVESRLLMENLLGQASLPAALAERIFNAAAGNPFFVEEMLRTMADDGRLERENGSWRVVGELAGIEVPATIQAVLAARLERLTAPERRVIECAAVIGEEFCCSAVRELSARSARGDVPGRIEALVEKELLRRGGAPFLGEEPFRFSHLLIRDVAYLGLLKELRAKLHERFAGWLEEHSGERVTEHAELIGYHLEQAYRYRKELGATDEHALQIAHRAGSLLGAAGMRADARGDGAALNLLERAISLLPASDPTRPELLLALGAAREEAGGLDRALSLLGQAAREAGMVGNRRVELLAPLWSVVGRFDAGEADTTAELRELAEKSVARLTELGDDAGLSVANEMLGRANAIAMRLESATESFQRALPHAQGRSIARSVTGYVSSIILGPIPVEEAIRRLDEPGIDGDARPYAEGIPREAAASLAVRAEIGWGIASLEAMRGDFERARQLCRETEAFHRDFHQPVLAARLAGFIRGPIELMAGDLDAAERELRQAVEVLEEHGFQAFLSTILPELAQVLFAQGRYEEAEAVNGEGRAATAPGDVISRVAWRAVQAKLLARRGEVREGESLAREAVAIAAQTDALNTHARTLLDLAHVLGGAGREDAIVAGREALALYEAKGNLVGARDAASSLERL
jgi:class 3 adenylate cyclase/tetratricopeptide (TPR) repeat protein